MHAEHGHIQEVILQNFVPHQSYYGREPMEIAHAATRQYWRTGVWSGPRLDVPAWACEVTVADMERLVGHARRLLPGVGIQVPPNLSDWWPQLVRAGATDLGGLSANGDHISPEHPFPSPSAVRRQLAADGVALTERLCVYPEYIEPEWLSKPVLDVIKRRFWSFIPRRGSGRRAAPFLLSDELSPQAIAEGREGKTLSPQELTALFSERRPQVIEELRAAADELRSELAGDTVTFVVNRNINVSNICVVGCAFCGFGQSRRSPDAYEHSEEEFVRRVNEAIEFGATEICMQSGIHPDWGLEDYEKWLRVAKESCARHPFARLLADGGCAHVRRERALGARGVRPAARGGARLDPRDGGGGPARRREGADLAQQASRRPLGRDHRGLARGRDPLHGDGDVRSHRRAVGAGRAHACGA